MRLRPKGYGAVAALKDCTERASRENVDGRHGPEPSEHPAEERHVLPLARSAGAGLRGNRHGSGRWRAAPNG